MAVTPSVLRNVRNRPATGRSALRATIASSEVAPRISAAVDGGEVGGVEAAGEARLYLTAAYLYEHSVETVLDELYGEVGRLAHAVKRLASGGVLEHDGAVAVVGVAEGEGVRAEAVEERLLGPR